MIAWNDRYADDTDAADPDTYRDGFCLLRKQLEIEF